MSDGRYLQSLQRGPNGRVLQVKAHLHPDSNQHIVFWDDILHAFPDATKVLNGTEIVSPVRDASFRRVTPKCIKYYPGKVLEVVGKEEQDSMGLRGAYAQELTRLNIEQCTRISDKEFTQKNGSSITTLELDSTWRIERIRGVYDAICDRGFSALEKLVWDITELNNVYILKLVLAILNAAQMSKPSKKIDVEIQIRLLSDMSSGSRFGYTGQLGLSRFVESENRDILWILFTSYVTRLKLFGRNLDTFLPKLCQSFDWTMSALTELVVDGQSTQLSLKSLNYLQDIIRRSTEVTGTKSLKPGRPLTQLYIQNISLLDQQWTLLLSSIDWLTLRKMSFRGCSLKLAQLIEIETAIVRAVEQCQAMQHELSSGSKDPDMLKYLMIRQSGESHLMVSLYRTEVTDQQALEAMTRLYKRRILWCSFTMADV
ncbi:hypothetical protein EC991_003055 [Linnemannia zychae]|nr:hypothetical protein EC991_003055 [Linnemannia zychae]